MVKNLLLAAVLFFAANLLNAQSLSIGFKLGSGIGSQLTTGEPRDYYIIYDYYHRRTSGKGYMVLNSFIPPEVFIRYELKNRIFIQFGTSLGPERILTFYGLDPEIQEKYASDSRYDYEDPMTGVVVPMDHLGTRSFYMNTFLHANYYLFKGTTLKPYLSLGINPSFLTLYDPLNDGSVILKDFGKKNEVILNARAAVGIQFYDIHLEIYGITNLTPIDESPNSYNERVNKFYLSFGYNILTFNTVKKVKL